MKVKLTLLATLLVVAATLTRAQTYKALFIGNSYTAGNNLPNMVAQLADANGDSLIFDSHTPGATQLMDHAVNATALSKISSQEWDFVVLQAQSQEPSWPDGQMATDVYPYAVILNDSIKSNNECTETVFFMTWGRRYGDNFNCPGWPPVCTFDGMTARLRHGYSTMANANDATIAPAGPAWRNSWAADSNVVLHTPDNSHPNLSGSYLTACVFYATLYKKSPVGNTYTAGLSVQDAAYLQDIAKLTVLDSIDNWRIGHDDPRAYYTYTQNGLTVDFTDSSTNANGHYWSIDGANYSTPNVSHTFSSAGVYTVRLEVWDDCDTVVYQDYVEVGPVGIEEVTSSNNSIKVFPNPSNDWVNIELQDNEADITISDLHARIVAKHQGNKWRVDVSTWKSGVYLVKSGENLVRLVKH